MAPPPVFLHEKFTGQRSLVDSSQKVAQSQEDLATKKALYYTTFFWLLYLCTEASSLAVLSKIVLPSCCPLRFHINCGMDFSISEKTSIGISVGIETNL